jgi:hypothetical protein
MKKLLLILTIATVAFFACNDPKDPPDEGATKAIQAYADSLAKVDSLNKQ